MNDRNPVLLIIDDDPSVREVIAACAELEGFRALQAEDGSRGLDLAATCAPSLILCDLRMPRMSGQETLRALRAHPATSEFKTVMMGGLSEFDEAEWKRRGADGFLPKPFSLSELAAWLRNAEPRNEAACRRYR